jgi:hypothetical protein
MSGFRGSHLCHPTINFAAVHSKILTQRCSNGIEAFMIALAADAPPGAAGYGGFFSSPVRFSILSSAPRLGRARLLALVRSRARGGGSRAHIGSLAFQHGGL